MSERPEHPGGSAGPAESPESEKYTVVVTSDELSVIGDALEAMHESLANEVHRATWSEDANVDHPDPSQYIKEVGQKRDRLRGLLDRLKARS